MNRLLPLSRPLLRKGRSRAELALLLIAFSWSYAHAQAVNPNIVLGNPCGVQPQMPQITYAAKPGDTVGQSPNPQVNGEISVINAPSTVFWELSPQTGCAGTVDTIQCAGASPVFSVQAPTGAVSPATSAGRVQLTNTRTITAADVGSSGIFGAQVADAADGDPVCTWQYKVQVTNDGGGWGDPHITTVDGTHYDFQSAGEFTALRQKELEIQTRQTAVPTASVPNANPYTGLSTCVAIYTAVALRIGSNRVTLQPNISGQPDPSGMQLRVNGKLVTLTDEGITLMSGGGVGATQPGVVEGRIVKAAGNAIEIRDASGTQVVVTPAFWQSQQTWYLNVNVYQTSATEGIMGRLATRSWLPALPDGSSLGPKPEALDQRYQDLYEKFADAWRVTDATSLFDYAPGTSTATFTLDEWPRYAPQSCALEGQTSAQPATPAVAAQACAGITNADQKADCIFDVTFTGHTGFAESYETMQGFKPHGTGWQQPPLTARTDRSLWFWILYPWFWIAIAILVLIVIAVLLTKKTRTA
jgi:von Willebrand factor type D domain